MASSTTIRVSPQTRDSLNRLARDANTTTAEYVDKLVARLEDEQILDEMIAGMEDPTFAAEATEWDAVDVDGLDPSDDFSAWR